jgi:hypothetical protein
MVGYTLRRLMVENISVHHHLGTYPEYMRVSVYLLFRAVVGGLFIGRSSIIYFFLRSENLLSLFLFDISIISIFNCQVKNYFWNAVNNLIVLVSAL